MFMICATGMPSAINSCSMAAISLASHCRTRAVRLALTSAAGLAFVKVTDDLFQRPDAVGPVVKQFAHARTPPPGRVPGSGAHAG